MKPRVRNYLLLAAVFLLSGTLTYSVQGGDLLKGILATPSLVALLSVVYQVLQSHSEFQKTKHLQSDQQIFALAATSHMAEVAFDKHAEFCEEYMSVLHEVVGDLFRHGATSNAHDGAFRLQQVRRKFAAWLPRSAAEKLNPFERAIIDISANSQLAKSLESSDSESRSKAIERAHSLLMAVLGIRAGKDSCPESAEIASEHVKESVRRVLGIEEITLMREFIIQRSMNFMRESSSGAI